jgi:hypothetical protein
LLIAKTITITFNFFLGQWTPWLLGSHKRQVWRYIDRYLDVEKVDVCPGIIYKSPPSTPGLREEIEEYLNEWGLQVVWYEE